MKGGVDNLEKMKSLNLRKTELCHLWQPQDGQERLCWVLELQPWLPQLSSLNI